MTLSRSNPRPVQVTISQKVPESQERKQALDLLRVLAGTLATDVLDLSLWSGNQYEGKLYQMLFQLALELLHEAAGELLAAEQSRMSVCQVLDLL